MVWLRLLVKLLKPQPFTASMITSSIFRDLDDHCASVVSSSPHIPFRMVSEESSPESAYFLDFAFGLNLLLLSVIAFRVDIDASTASLIYVLS